MQLWNCCMGLWTLRGYISPPDPDRAWSPAHPQSGDPSWFYTTQLEPPLQRLTPLSLISDLFPALIQGNPGQESPGSTFEARSQQGALG